MKRIYTFCMLLLWAVAAWGQTANEIISHMEAAMKDLSKTGIAMTMETKIPLLGTVVAKSWQLQDKMKMETEMMGKAMATYTDGVTLKLYSADTNELTIADLGSSSGDSTGDAELFSIIQDGYDVSIQSETADNWVIECKKSKSNKIKEVPKKMEVTIKKGTYHPLRLKTKMNGIGITMHIDRFGVSEKEVSFNEGDYPGVKIIDKRK